MEKRCFPIHRLHVPSTGSGPPPTESTKSISITILPPEMKRFMSELPIDSRAKALAFAYPAGTRAAPTLHSTEKRTHNTSHDPNEGDGGREEQDNNENGQSGKKITKTHVQALATVTVRYDTAQPSAQRAKAKDRERSLVTTAGIKGHRRAECHFEKMRE